MSETALDGYDSFDVTVSNDPENAQDVYAILACLLPKDLVQPHVRAQCLRGMRMPLGKTLRVQPAPAHPRNPFMIAFTLFLITVWVAAFLAVVFGNISFVPTRPFRVGL